MAKAEQIRDLKIETNDAGRIVGVTVVFGPHHAVEIRNTKSGVEFVLVATHHGFKADASEVNGQLEKIINEARRKHPELAVD